MRRRQGRVAGAAVLVALLAGCTAVPAGGEVLVELERVGGLCPDGEECRTVLVLRDDGTWERQGEDEARGRLGAADAATLRDLAASVTPEDLVTGPATAPCPRDADGSEHVVTVRPGAPDEIRSSSCADAWSGHRLLGLALDVADR